MRPSHRKLLLGLASTLGSLALATWIWNTRAQHDTVDLVDVRPLVEDLFAERSREVAAPPAAVEVEVTKRESIPPAVAVKLFPSLGFGGERFVYDPDTYFWVPGNQSSRIEFREHEPPTIEIHVNDLGFRKDRDVRTDKPDVRILVGGDSHTEGVVPNAELYTELLEARLANAMPGRSVEVLNGGKGGFSFHNYLGLLEKFAALEPDVFIVTVYGGNDFKELLKPYRYFQRLPLGPPLPRPWRAPLSHASKRYHAIVSQFLSQVLIFKASEEEERFARECSMGLTSEIARRCAQEGIEFVLVYLPPIHDVQKDRIADMVAGVTELFDLTEEDLGKANAMASELLDHARGEAITCVDLRDVFRDRPEKLYWEKDHHLSAGGHALVAEALEPILRSLLAE